MKNIILFFILMPAVIFLTASNNTSFKQQQLANSRVQTAYKEKETTVKKLLMNKHIDISKMNMLIRVFKTERVMEIWAKNSGAAKYVKVKEYPICTMSGNVGPKRISGDGQTPEGFYYIDRFNPSSNFYLSLGINYPNASDRIISKGKNTGGDIFIHGNCVSIGCMPITDELIKEVYIMATEARNNGQQKIPVYIFPFKMNKAKMAAVSENKSLLAFWNNLLPGYNIFENTNKEVAYTVQQDGKYRF